MVTLDEQVKAESSASSHSQGMGWVDAEFSAVEWMLRRKPR